MCAASPSTTPVATLPVGVPPTAHPAPDALSVTAPLSANTSATRSRGRPKGAVKVHALPSLERSAVATIVSLKILGYSGVEIEKKTGFSHARQQYLLRKAHTEKWIRMDEDGLTPEEHVALRLIPKAVRNTDEFLDAKDKDVTLETMKGGGLFKVHQAQKVGEGGVPVALQINIDTGGTGLPATTVLHLPAGSIGGVPGFVEGAVTNEHPLSSE